MPTLDCIVKRNMLQILQRFISEGAQENGDICMIILYEVSSFRS